jgi:catechol 2,3-dioxygenase-like lactoylglutathione lyase family enzyme
MESRLSIVTLGVSDLARSVRFYRDGLGLLLREGSGDVIAFFETKGTWLALFPREALAADANVACDGAGFSGFTLAHNVRSREAVDELLREAVAAGASIVKPAEETDWGGYSGYFSDPDGFLWEVAWNPHFWIE